MHSVGLTLAFVRKNISFSDRIQDQDFSLEGHQKIELIQVEYAEISEREKLDFMQ